MKNMKRLYGLFVLLCLMLTACNDDFLDVDPVDRYSDAVVWTDESLITFTRDRNGDFIP